MYHGSNTGFGIPRMAALQVTADGTEGGAATPGDDTVITLVQKMVDLTLATSSAPPMRRLTLGSMKSLGSASVRLVSCDNAVACWGQKVHRSHAKT